MRDLLRARPPAFDGSGGGLEVETWMIDLDRCFAMHPYGSNTRARCAIMHLRGFASTWWQLEEQKLHIDINLVVVHYHKYSMCSTCIAHCWLRSSWSLTKTCSAPLWTLSSNISMFPTRETTTSSSKTSDTKTVHLTAENCPEKVSIVSFVQATQNGPA